MPRAPVVGPLIPGADGAPPPVAGPVLGRSGAGALGPAGPGELGPEGLGLV